MSVGTGGLSFSPASVQLNLGDHVVWVWVATGHSTTSGTVAGNTLTPDGIWDTGTLAITASVKPAFTWKSDRTGTLPYYCTPHATSGMTGTVQVVASGAAVSNFRITEVQYVAATHENRIQITNMGSADGNLGRYRVTISETPGTATTGTIAPNDVPVLAGASVTLHWGRSGTPTSTDIYLGALANLTTTGSFALYAPNTTAEGSLFSDASRLIDYVAWGAPGQPNEATASAATADGTTIWTAGDFVAGETLPGYSIAYCGSGVEHGAAHWQVSTPNFGAASLCATPTIRTTWGRIKSLYR